MSSLTIKIQTNLPVAREVETAITSEATALLASEMPTPHDSIASTVESKADLRFAGSSAPAAFVEVRSATLPPQGRVLGQKLAALVHRHFTVPSGRVYVTFVSSASGIHRRTAAA